MQNRTVRYKRRQISSPIVARYFIIFSQLVPFVCRRKFGKLRCNKDAYLSERVWPSQSNSVFFSTVQSAGGKKFSGMLCNEHVVLISVLNHVCFLCSDNSQFTSEDIVCPVNQENKVERALTKVTEKGDEHPGLSSPFSILVIWPKITPLKSRCSFLKKLMQLKKQALKGMSSTSGRVRRRGVYMLCLLPGFASPLKKWEVAVGDMVVAWELWRLDETAFLRNTPCILLPQEAWLLEIL